MKLRWLRIVVPTALPCVNLEAVVSIVNAEHVRIRANHIGPDPDASGTDCIFLSGIDAQSSANAQILFNRVTGFDDYGIVVNTAMDGTRIARNLVRATYLHAAAQPVYDYGLLNSDNVTMTYNYAYGRSDVQTGDLRYFVGVTADGGTIGTITNNHFVDETLAISTAATTGGTITYNHAVSGIATGIRIGGQSAEIAYNRFSGTGVGIGANNASADNDIHDNNALGPSDPDCSDFSTGTGTAGTANTWTDNLGDTSSPAGICGPAS